MNKTMDDKLIYIPNVIDNLSPSNPAKHRNSDF